jgi:ABC-2 type transport system permease protein
VIGLRSVFGKTLRDSRRAIAIAAVFLAIVIVSGAAAMAAAFGRAATREQAKVLADTMPPVLQGLLGPPIGLTTLGGFVEWRFYAVIALLLPIWSILALSSTLAGEADRGSLDVVLSGVSTRRRVAVEKVLGHLAAVAITMALTAVCLVVAGTVFATVPGDAIPVEAAVGFVALTAVLTLIPGAIAFAAAPLIGRGAAAGLAGGLMVLAYFASAFRSSIGVFDLIAPVSWFAWLHGHVPLAGVYDWPALGAAAGVVAALLALGVWLFLRSDVGITVRVPIPGLPRPLVGLRGPFGRSFGERLPASLAWGIGLGAYVFILTAAVPSMQELFRAVPSLSQLMARVYPGVDIASYAGVLQLTFAEFGLIVIGIAAASLVAGWASEEASGRLETVLAAPLTRAAWVIRSGLGLYAAELVIVTCIATAAAIGASSLGDDPGRAFAGTYFLALYGTALSGLGIAMAGLFRVGIGGAVVVAVTVLSFLDEILAVALNLPNWVADLALSTHYGKPFLGEWDPVGILASLALAFGGLLVGAWGLRRRDLRG